MIRHYITTFHRFSFFMAGEQRDQIASNRNHKDLRLYVMQITGEDNSIARYSSQPSFDLIFSIHRNVALYSLSRAPSSVNECDESGIIICFDLAGQLFT